MKAVFLLSSCDTWHSRSSYQPIGVFSTLKLLIRYLKQYDKLTEEDFIQILSIGQTQGRSANYCAERFTVNPTNEA